MKRLRTAIVVLFGLIAVSFAVPDGSTANSQGWIDHHDIIITEYCLGDCESATPSEDCCKTPEEPE